MIRTFQNEATEDIYNGRDTRVARRLCPRLLWPAARRKLDALNYAIAVIDLRTPPGNRLEALRGDRTGQYSIRINDQFRICFAWQDGDALSVEIIDYHD